MTLGRKRVLIAMAILVASLTFLSVARRLVALEVDPRFVGTWSGADFRGGELTLRSNGTGIVVYPSKAGDKRVEVQWSATGSQLQLRFVNLVATSSFAELKTQARAVCAKLTGAPNPMSFHRFEVLHVERDALRMRFHPSTAALAQGVVWERVRVTD
jgi:hypothetical protein